MGSVDSGSDKGEKPEEGRRTSGYAGRRGREMPAG